MKYFSEQGNKRTQSNFTAEFADDFWVIEETLAQTAIAGGVISKRIIDTANEILKKP